VLVRKKPSVLARTLLTRWADQELALDGQPGKVGILEIDTAPEKVEGSAAVLGSRMHAAIR
jgi:hypothetical protein